MTTPHNALRKEICEYLSSIGAWHHCASTHGYGRSGVPDILACYRGRFVSIEVKVAPDKPSPWQHREGLAIERAGGLWIVAYDVRAVHVIAEPHHS